MSLSLSLLGMFRASLNGQPLTEFYSNKVRALLAYLAVEAEQEHPRPVLAALLWPDWDDRAALGNLRFSLSKLRQVIHDQDARPPFLLINRDSIQLNLAADVGLDVHRFQQELHASRWESADVDGQPESVLLSALEHLRTAIDLVCGGFLEGFSVGDSVAFEEWTLLQRQHLEREVRWCLHGLAALYGRLGDYAAAELHVRRLLTMDPWDELANRRLMLVLLQEGQRTFALRHYAAFHEELARELGCEPEEETQALYAQIRDGALPLSASYHPGAKQSGPSLIIPEQSGVDPIPAPAPSEGEGSSPPPRFVARDWELARLGSLLEGAVTGRGGVALIAGEAGAGKTALLDEFARRAGLSHVELIVLRGSCNAHGGAGDPYLPFREILQTLAGDVEGKRASGTLSSEQARRAWEALPAVGAALVEHGPDLIDTFVPGEALQRRVEGFPALSPAKGRGPTGVGRPLGRGPSPRTPSFPSDPVLRDKGGTTAGQVWLPQLREIVRRSQEGTAAASGSGAGVRTPAPQPDLLAQVTRVLHAVSLNKPLLLAVDDLQWADGGTAALLFHLGRRLAGSRILLVCAYRPEAIHGPPDLGGLGDPRGLRPVLQELTREWGDVMVDLDRADGRGFVEALVDSEPNCLGASFRQALYAHTEGNPLFTVELLRSFERQGALVRDAAGRWIEAHELKWDQPPARVEAIIAGHLAGLPDEDRTLLQAASVQGEQFVAEVVARVLGWDEAAVLQRLSGPLRTRHRLVEAVSLERLASTGQRLTHYRFRHALLHRGAYNDIDALERGRLHEATGRALETICAGAGERPPTEASEHAQTLAPELARHYEAAGLPLEAARHRLEAGRWAARLVAYDEAIAHLECGLTLLEGAAASGERLRLELALCLALVHPALLRQGWQAPAYRRALGRLSDLVQHPALQDDPQHLSALTALALLTVWSADPERGRRMGEQLLGLAESSDRQSLVLAHWVLGHSQWFQGQYIAVREHLSQALALDEPGAGHPLSPVLGADPGVIGHSVLGSVLWLLGYPDLGRASIHQALARAQAIDQPSTTAFAHLMAGAAYILMGRDATAALSHARALSTLRGAGLEYAHWAELLAGQARAQEQQAGTSEEEAAFQRGLVQAAEAESALGALGSGVGHAAQLLVQAQLCARADQAERGLEAMEQAQAWIEDTGVRMLEAEVCRTRGDLLLMADRRDRSPDLSRLGSRRPRLASSARWGWPASSRRAGWSYGRRSAWRGSGRARAGATTPASCWLASMAGSPKGSTRWTWSRRRRCWQS
jgi:DNA-binding SARP family transcriptional activator